MKDYCLEVHSVGCECSETVYAGTRDDCVSYWKTWKDDFNCYSAYVCDLTGVIVERLQEYKSMCR